MILIGKLDTTSIAEKYPKALELFEKEVRDKLMKDFEPLGGDKEEDEKIADMVLSTTSIGIRELYDFFDNYQIFVVIDCANYETGDSWFPVVCNIDLDECTSRSEAEIIAFTEAFHLLEVELNKDNVNKIN